MAWRSIHNFLTNPAFLVPSLLFPLFFFVSFAGGLAAIGEVPGFDFPSGYTAFQFVFVLLQSAAFGGVFTGFAMARDFETGFGRRYMLAASRRSGIVAGYALAALFRAFVTWTVLTAVALVAEMESAAAPAKSSPSTRWRSWSTSPRRCGPPGWRCGSARSRAAR